MPWAGHVEPKEGENSLSADISIGENSMGREPKTFPSPLEPCGMTERF